MIVFRRRLLYWLIREYAKRLRKTILIFFILGIAAFFGIRFLITYFLPKIPLGHKEIIGLAGTFTIDSLPHSIFLEASDGLTKILRDGTPIPSLSESWKISPDGKEYVFHLKKNTRFNDGVPATSSNIHFNFSDVSIIKPNQYDIVFRLRNSYSPFLVTLSKPVFKNGFVGTGEYKIKSIDLNGNFVKSLTFISKKNQYHVKIYQFYPTEESLKMAFILGEIKSAFGITRPDFRHTSLFSFPNVVVNKKINYDKLVSLFYNTQDKIVSDKRLRQGLSYAIPSEFKTGQRSYAPFPPGLWAYQKSVNEPVFDIEHAKVLLAASNASDSASLSLRIKTLPKYKTTAQRISDAWKKIGIASTIEVIDTIPSDYQVFLGDFQIPKDPDQYTLWHSNQDNNITKFKNVRIDKLLEDGRKTIETNSRKKIYADFLKYLLDESPASFLYFPYEYDLVRK
ncbi:MAG: hypothetical protein A3F31_05280 [Candidatus Levybacteria bacterium RIFCSPHIGHO2_12_FULL_38_12]|nr:MAG: hypothetical protein A2770_02090 [Candidatus Levybacteria bacterium RIFCSPHIGHO2_01_FULL_38_12]OGH22273.1 MAG: hypothetical protein A3D75_01715 [Candidatus Levybacteria bacterium RIFCSPHIGHO2_02_FULL_37_18]OGH23361.1 MAG: hypothetical protein A3F31_05280 [Candidatus Levybacteria bacterium RIFCSPHIGHO2_12_FULL_38_12]OGH34536.1 MAG: hypothetical protein A3A47_01040 [Candidatus Levybacteria bacterium RIFCSPLOWO2_01_FULL_37_20]OGH43417.1 MAG: hypothetical protein A3J14_02745 [Candidatus Lev